MRPRRLGFEQEIARSYSAAQEIDEYADAALEMAPIEVADVMAAAARDVVGEHWNEPTRLDVRHRDDRGRVGIRIIDLMSMNGSLRRGIRRPAAMDHEQTE